MLKALISSGTARLPRYAQHPVRIRPRRLERIRLWNLGGDRALAAFDGVHRLIGTPENVID